MAREVFKPAPKPERGPDSEVIYYTITADDVGKRFIKTTEGTIPAGEVIGEVQRRDVSKRFYRVLDEAGVSHVWQCENDAQRDGRLERRPGVHKARPFRPSDADPAHCAVCMQRIRRVTGGHGSTWVHSDSGAVAGSGADPLATT